MPDELIIDLCCGTGGWADGFLAEGFDVIGYDIENLKYTGQLVLQDVRTIEGYRFRGATLIVASPPCQEFSRHSMPCFYPPETLQPPDLSIVDACFRIAVEARLPLILENVVGAQKFIGRATARYGKRWLWGNGIPALLPYEAPDRVWCGRNRRVDRSKQASRIYVKSAIGRSRIEFSLSNYIARYYAGRLQNPV